jgi:hypothetical protein
MKPDGEVQILETRVTEWKFIDPDNNIHIFTDPIEFQQAQSVYSEIDFSINSSALPSQEPRTTSKY